MAGAAANSVALRTTVAIVGGGPVGTALAIALAQRNIECVLIERYPTPQAVPKGQNLTQRTMEHFRSWGIEAQLRDARTMSKERRIAGMTTYGSLLSGTGYKWMPREIVQSFYAAANERLPQYATERVLRARLAQFPTATALYAWSADGIIATDTGVTVEISANSGEHGTIVADYVVGCDGARSVVRQAMGITQTRADHDRRMVLAVFRSSEFDELMEQGPDVSFANVLHPDLEGYWQFFGRVDDTQTWFFHAPVDADATAESLDLDDILFRAVGERFAYSVEYLGFWDLRFALADTYRVGRVFLAGDAAHSHPPYGGYGINTGFEDATNLAWKLAAAVEGWAGADLLDSYDAERRPVFASTRDDFIDRSITADREFLATYDPVRNSDEFTLAWTAREQAALDEVDAFEPNYEGSPVVFGAHGGTPRAVGAHEVRARAGHHLAPQTTRHGHEIFAFLGTGFTLLSADYGSARAFVAAADRMGVPLSVLLVSEDAVAAYEASHVLVRPDQFVAWAGDATQADPDLILRSASGRPVQSVSVVS